jgi:hypothetical protein
MLGPSGVAETGNGGRGVAIAAVKDRTAPSQAAGPYVR